MPQSLSAAAIVTDRSAYAARARELRAHMREVRRARRIDLGDLIALEFENAKTLQYQVQEMVYVEGLTERADVAHEIEAYERLLPGPYELTATFLVELDDVATVRSELERLTGAHHAVAIEVGGHVVPGTEIPGPDEEGPSAVTVSVHFLRFTFDDAARDAFRDPDVPATLSIDHPHYAETVPIRAETRRALLADLALS